MTVIKVSSTFPSARLHPSPVSRRLHTVLPAPIGLPYKALPCAALPNILLGESITVMSVTDPEGRTFTRSQAGAGLMTGTA